MRTGLKGAADSIDKVQNLIKEHEDNMRSDLDRVDSLLSVS